MRGGVEAIQGLDFGDNTANLLIPKENFLSKDLSKEIDLNRKFDLVISCEVAEHIDKKCAEIFVGNLCRHGDLILFSAAIPGQFGTGHINEQWPSYWRDLFAKYNYKMWDVLRPKFWYDNRIEACYRQNMLLFTSENFKGEINLPEMTVTDVVHPEYFEVRSNRVIELKEQKLSQKLRKIFKSNK